MCYILIAPSKKQQEDNILAKMYIKYLLFRRYSFLLLYVSIIIYFPLQLFEQMKLTVVYNIWMQLNPPFH